MQTKKSSLKRRNTEEEVQFQRRDEEIYTEEDTIRVNPCRVLSEVTRDHCSVLVLAVIGAAGVGCCQPLNGLVMAHAMNGLNSMYETIRYDKGLKFAMIFLALAFIQGVLNFLMIWMFTRIGVALARIYRKSP